MALKAYTQKRSFKQSPEPTGGKSKGNQLIFVIQKHAASHLHYDFRLEMDGVLKSWAVPKGPSTDPSVKRLAMMVEDHPYDYKDFEGNIPAGNYGAGTVIVWDYGTYEPLESVKGKAGQEKLLLKELKAGSLKFALHGQKLHGEFALVHTKGRGDNAWLLIKHRDKYAKESDITAKDKSAVSGMTLEKVAAAGGPETVKKSRQPAGKTRHPVEKITEKTVRTNAITRKIKAVVNPKNLSKKVKKKTGFRHATDSLKDAPLAPLPKKIVPMLATLVDQPFDEDGWLYEIKWDGYRAVAFCNKSKVSLVSRNQKSFADKFYPIYEAVKQWGIQAVVDGEIAVLNEKGISRFNALQNWRSEADGELVYYVFDLLWLNGHDLKYLPLTRRRALLTPLIPETGPIRMSENFQSSATELLATAGKLGLEGIIAKKADSTYLEGDRSRDWLKMKINKRHEVVIGGYTLNKGSSKIFSSLLVGVFVKGKLHYTGKVGTGFSASLQRDMLAQFKPLIVQHSPFSEEPDVNKPSRFRPDPPHTKAVWLKPKLVCEVHYTEITEDGVMRHPSFEGMREDKNAADVGPEKPLPAEKAAKIPDLHLNAGNPKELKTLLNPSEETQVKKVKGHELTFSHLSKIFWPKEKYTKRDLLNYYYQAAPYIIPYLKDRPQSLNRFPNGIEGQSFYQKDVTNIAPDWVKQFPYEPSTGGHKNFLVGEDEASLLWMVNLGAIEMNPWNSTIHKPDYPDWCIIDLDPSEKNNFEQVIRTAQVTKTVLDSLKIPGYCKTSGSTGMHIYIPMGAQYTYDQCQLLGKWIATEVNHALPEFTSIERMTQKRKGKLYVDYLQNRPQATLAAPYSVRPKPGATVSMPLHWEEVKKGLTMSDFTIKNAMARIQSEGDIFKPVLGKGINLKKLLSTVLKRL